MGKNAPYRKNPYRWRKLRKRLLRREPLCRSCHANGIIRIATDVDHIVPISRGGLHWELSNLQPLCKSCHHEKTINEAEQDNWRGRPIFLRRLFD